MFSCWCTQRIFCCELHPPVPQLPTIHTKKQRSTMTFDKGDRISIIAGKYEGCTAWYDEGKKAENGGHPKKLFYVIVLYKHEERESVAEYNFMPDSYLAAAIHPQPKITKLINKLVEKLVECSVSSDDEACHKLFVQHFEQAERKQREKGADAVWRHIDFESK
mmetsp:Transcript_3427/g.9741  ORF Transcript_3427/g.9741 Transcript_3427/m.9741 type:complete len:163 (+) Transcript_3427:99-587(+)